MSRRRGLLGVSKGRLPSEYQEVEYIESHANAYIDTDWIPSNNIVIKTDMEITQLTYAGSIWKFIHGSRSANAYEWFVGFLSDSYKFCSLQPPQEGSTNYYYTNDTSISLNTRHVVIWGAGASNIVVDGSSATTQNTQQKRYRSTRPIRLMAMNDSQTSGGNAQRLYAKYYHIELWNEANMNHINLIPCYRKSDGVIGMYDIVNGVFYTNSGTGTFTKGNDV